MITGIVSLFSNEGAHPALYCAFVIYVLALSLPLSKSFLRTPALFHPLFFYATWMGLRSLLTGDAVLGAVGLEYHSALLGKSSTELDYVAARSFLLEALALAAMYLGYCALPTIEVTSLKKVGFPKKLPIAAALWMLLPLAAALVLIQETGGLGNLILQRGIASDQRISAELGGHWNYLAGVGTVVPIVWLAFDRRATRRWDFWALALLAACLVFIATGSRSSAIMPFITIALMWALRNQTIPYRALSISAVIAIVLVGLLGEFRTATREIDHLDNTEFQFEVWSGAQSGYNELIERKTTNNGQLAILGNVPDRVDYLFGESYLSIPFIVIPRAIYPSETPDAAGKLNATRIYDKPLSGIPAGIVGEAYWNFSYFGIILSFALFGVLLRFASSIYKKNSDHALVISIYLYTLTKFSPGSNAVFNFVHALIPVILFFSFVVLIELIKINKSSNNTSLIRD